MEKQIPKRLFREGVIGKVAKILLNPSEEDLLVSETGSYYEWGSVCPNRYSLRELISNRICYLSFTREEVESLYHELEEIKNDNNQ